MLDDLKKDVLEANLELNRKGIVIYTWGNVSGLDSSGEIMAIKPSGISYESMKHTDIVLVDVASGTVVDGQRKPSSDTNTHLVLYRNFKDIKGIAHTHSINAIAFAQAGRSIPALGTTHADYFYGEIPCTRVLDEQEVFNDYEYNTGAVIAETFNEKNISPVEVPGVLVNQHGPFAWGKDVFDAVHNAVVLEVVAEMAMKTELLGGKSPLPQYILDKHYFRKHGKNAYYGQ